MKVGIVIQHKGALNETISPSYGFISRTRERCCRRRPARPSASASDPRGRQGSDRQGSDPGSRRSHARAKFWPCVQMIHRGCTMPHMSAVYLCLAVAASALAGCAPPLYYQTVHSGTFPEQPPDYSPDYTSVPVVAPNGGTRWVLELALYRTRQSLRSWDRICRRAAPTHTTFSAWPSASLTWFTAARSVPLPRLRRHERCRNTFMVPRELWGAAFRVCRTARRRGPGPRARPRWLLAIR